MTGTVTDASTGDGIAGATILVKGSTTTILVKGSTTQWATTDAMGAYTIAAPADAVLEVRFMGYTTIEVPVNGRSSIDVELEMETEMLDDVIVVGYGTARKISSVVGSASTVNKKALANRPSSNAGDALQGQVSGLQVFSSSGEPAENVSMRLRGVNSINASTTPLVVLDGAPVSISVFNSLNSNDIENVVVMKDASSTAIYGSRAANGVIYITTKKGKRGEKPVVTLSGQYGISTVVNHRMDLMNSSEWFTFNKMVDPDFKMTPYQEMSQKLGINTNWLDYFFNEAAPVWSADLSVSGASEKTDYYFSLGTFDQTGTLPNSFMSRYNFRMNVNTRVTDWLKMGANVGLAYQEYQTAGFATAGNNWHNPTTAANWMAPWYSPYAIKTDENGDPYIDYSEERNDFTDYMAGLYNTYYVQRLQPQTNNTTRLNGSTYIELTPIKGLTLRAQQNIEAYDYRYTYKCAPVGPFAGNGQASEAWSRYYQFTFTNTAEYNFDIAGKHNFSILAGQESIFNDYESLQVDVSGILDNRNNLISQGTTAEIPSWSEYQTSYNSYFARLSYNYDEKYYVDASWRIDGSSLFGLDNQYANFYSVGAMWDIKREEWMQGASWIQDLRLKASYGTTGNSGISNYLAFGDLTWETVANLNIGVSARMWNFMNVNVEFYNKKTSDLLFQIPFSMTTGHAGGWGNAGDMVNRGVDLDLTFDVVQTNDIYFGITTNFNYNYNKILSLVGGMTEFTFANTGISYQPGYPIGEFYFVRSAGVDPRDGMQMWYDTDGNLTKNFSDGYAVMTGKQRYAPWSGGIQLNFQWKGLYVGADFSWVAGKWTINNDRYFLTNPLFITANSNGVSDMLNMWMEPGDITDIPAAESARDFDTSLLEDASFFRLKNLQISYAFPEKWMRRTGFISGFRVYAIARNLFTLTKYTGYDPEVDSNLQMGVYPNSRQFTIGAEFTF